MERVPESTKIAFEQLRKALAPLNDEEKMLLDPNTRQLQLRLIRELACSYKNSISTH